MKKEIGKLLYIQTIIQIYFLENEFSMDHSHLSAQEFAKQNLSRMKAKKEAEIRMHAAVERKEFENSEKKRKRHEVLDKEWQMKKLEEEREQLKKDFENHEKYLEELNNSNILMLQRQQTNNKYIDSLRSKEKKETERRRREYYKKDASIENRIEVLSKSKERMVEAMRIENENKLIQTQNRFRSNLNSHRQRMTELANKKAAKSSYKISQIREEIMEESLKKQQLKSAAIEKAQQK